MTADDRSADDVDAAEGALQAAMVASDVDALGALLDAEAVYVGPDGEVVDREADLQAHRDGTLTIDRMEQRSRVTRRSGSTALTIVTVDLTARAGGEDVRATLRYHRTWTLTDSWRVVAASASVVAP